MPAVAAVHFQCGPGRGRRRNGRAHRRRRRADPMLESDSAQRLERPGEGATALAGCGYLAACPRIRRTSRGELEFATGPAVFPLAWQGANPNPGRELNLFQITLCYRAAEELFRFQGDAPHARAPGIARRSGTHPSLQRPDPIPIPKPLRTPGNLRGDSAGVARFFQLPPLPLSHLRRPGTIDFPGIVRRFGQNWVGEAYALSARA